MKYSCGILAAAVFAFLGYSTNGLVTTDIADVLDTEGGAAPVLENVGSGLTADESELAFGDVEDGSTSILDFSFNASNLPAIAAPPADVTISGSTNFTVSKSHDSGYGASVTVEQDNDGQNGDVQDTTIYVKFAPDAEEEFTGTVTLSYGGIETVIDLTGTGTPAIP